MNNKKTLSITVGIATCYSGDSLVKTVESIRNANLGESVKILVTADRAPMSKTVLDGLKRLRVGVTWNNVEGSQFKKVKQMIDKCKGDLYISTQDDVTFDKNTIEEIVNTFSKDINLTMAGIRILPLKPETFFESAMTSMLYLIDKVSGRWNKSDNHLSSSGRCLAFRIKHLKKFRIPENIVNGDMFLYLENKKLNGKFKQIKNSLVYIRCPQRLKDQIAPSSRYLYSKIEMQNFFNQKLESEYKISKQLLFKSLIEVFISQPIQTIFYILIRIYTFIFRQPKAVVSNPVWKVDTSTKKII